MSDEARRRVSRDWNRTVGPYYSRATLIRDLRISQAELDALVDQAEILRLEQGGREFFPAFQFAQDRSVTPGLREVRIALNPRLDPDLDWTVTWWLCIRRAEFAGANAVELLREGRLAEVIGEARNARFSAGSG